MQVIAKILSAVFHPVFAALYAYLVIFFVGTYHSYLPLQIKEFILLVVLINTVVVPLVLLYLLKLLGLIKQVELNDRKDRLVAFVMIIVAYTFTLYMFRRLGLPLVLLKIIIGGIVAMLAAMLVTYWWKISCHSVGIGGFTGFLFALAVAGLAPLGGLLLVSLLLSGLLMSARLLLGAHCPSQVYAGYALGFIAMLLLV